jgi:hypothetical protein
MSGPDRFEAAHSSIEVRVDDLDHDAWNLTTPVLLSHYWCGETAPASRHARARLLWTESALLAHFVCQQQEPLIINSTPQTEKKTLRLWDRDVCELFLLPDLTKPDCYFEFEAAPTGEWLDVALRKTVDGRETDWEYSSGMTTAARLHGNEVIIAIRIPWGGQLGKPNAGDEWGMNLCRCVGSGKGRGYLAWRPTFTPLPNFHVPKRFGKLLFR